MLGLGTSIIRGNIHGVEDLGIIRDNLVLDHSNYNAESVTQVSTGAAYFNESNADYIEIADADTFSDADGFSISFWVYFTTMNGDTALITKHADYGDLDNSGEFYIINDDSICEFVVVDHANSASIGTKTGTVFTANKWHHVACTHDGGTAASGLLIYIDGVLQTHNANSTGSGFANINDTSQVLRLGAFADDGEPHDGYMCNVGFWSAVLSQAEIKSIMWKNYAGLTSDEKDDLVSWWNLDSTISDSAYEQNYVLDNNYTTGSELYQYENGDITGIVAQGSNTIESHENAVKVTFVDDDSGARWKFSNPATLTTNLTIDAWYYLTVTARINTGVANLRLVPTNGSPDNDTPAYVMGVINHTDFREYTTFFKATHATKNRFDMENMDGAETVWIKDVSLKLVTGNIGTLV